MADDIKSSVASFATFAEAKTAGNITDPGVLAVNEKITIQLEKIANLEHEINNLEESLKGKGGNGAAPAVGNGNFLNIYQVIAEKKKQLEVEKERLAKVEALKKQTLAVAKDFGGLDGVLLAEDVEKELFNLINSGATEEELKKKLDEFVGMFGIKLDTAKVESLEAEITLLEEKVARDSLVLNLGTKKQKNEVSFASLDELKTYKEELQKEVDSLVSEVGVISAKIAPLSKERKAIVKKIMALKEKERKGEISVEDSELVAAYVRLNEINGLEKAQGLDELTLERTEKMGIIRKKNAVLKKLNKALQDENSLIFANPRDIEKLAELKAELAAVKFDYEKSTAEVEKLTNNILESVRKHRVEKEEKKTATVKNIKDASSSLLDKAKIALNKFKLKVYDNGIVKVVEHFKKNKLKNVETKTIDLTISQEPEATVVPTTKEERQTLFEDVAGVENAPEKTSEKVEMKPTIKVEPEVKSERDLLFEMVSGTTKQEEKVAIEPKTSEVKSDRELLFEDVAGTVKTETPEKKNSPAVSDDRVALFDAISGDAPSKQTPVTLDAQTQSIDALLGTVDGVMNINVPEETKAKGK